MRINIDGAAGFSYGVFDKDWKVMAFGDGMDIDKGLKDETERAINDADKKLSEQGYIEKNEMLKRFRFMLGADWSMYKKLFIDAGMLPTPTEG